MTPKQDLVLVADSDLAVREALKFALEAEGFEVHSCAGWPELLAYPKLGLAACVVLDDKMPAMDGVSILARLVEGYPLVPVILMTMPVILMTGHATDGLRRRAASAGVRHVLEKPFLHGALVDSIHDVLGHLPSAI